MINNDLIKIRMMKIVLIFTILYLAFNVPLAFAQESSLLGQAPPTTFPPQLVSSSGSPFNIGWNYFTVATHECTLKNVFNELQAAGGGALLVQEIWKMENGKWEMFNIAGSDSVNVAVDDIFAFNSNQKFYLNIATDACKTKNTNRDLQIEQVRDASTKQKGDSFLEKLLSVPGDFWSGLLGKIEINKQNNASQNPNYSAETAIFSTLNVLGKTVVADLGVTGNISSGLLSINGLDKTVAAGSATINTLSNDLYLQNFSVAGINILNGKILIDKNGNIKTIGDIIAKKYRVDVSDIGSSSLGSGVIAAGSRSVTILTASVSEDSKIFVTPVTDTDKPLIIKNKVAGKSFNVTILAPYSSDIQFDWFIVN